MGLRVHAPLPRCREHGQAIAMVSRQRCGCYRDRQGTCSPDGSDRSRLAGAPCGPGEFSMTRNCKLLRHNGFPAPPVGWWPVWKVPLEPLRKGAKLIGWKSRKRGFPRTWRAFGTLEPFSPQVPCAKTKGKRPRGSYPDLGSKVPIFSYLIEKVRDKRFQ